MEQVAFAFTEWHGQPKIIYIGGCIAILTFDNIKLCSGLLNKLESEFTTKIFLSAKVTTLVADLGL